MAYITSLQETAEKETMERDRQLREKFGAIEYKRDYYE